MKFTLYSKDGCSYCKKAEKLLEIAKVEYRVYKLGTDFTREQFILNLYVPHFQDTRG